jgi:transposase InsO family protein
VVRRHDLSDHAARLFLSGGNHGLGKPQGLAWRLSNIMDAGFCVEALQDALARHGKPQIFTDRGSQFTSHAFTGVLAAAEIKISMEGPGRWMDNIFIERCCDR